MSFLLYGSNRQHISVCAKMIFGGVRKVLDISVGNMSLGTLEGATVSVAFVG